MSIGADLSDVREDGTISGLNVVRHYLPPERMFLHKGSVSIIMDVGEGKPQAETRIEREMFIRLAKKIEAGHYD